jgi:hypothetical protein
MESSTNKKLFWPMSLIPAICLAVFYLYFTFPISFYSRFLFLISIEIMLKTVIVPVLAVFLVNLAVPCAINRVKSFYFVAPTFIVHLYFYSFPIFWGAIMNAIYPGDTPGAYIGLLNLGVFSIPLEILFLGLTMFFAWFGAWLRKPRNHKS